jgi:hypothetical protein
MGVMFLAIVGAGYSVYTTVYIIPPRQPLNKKYSKRRPVLRASPIFFVLFSLVVYRFNKNVLHAQA